MGFETSRARQYYGDKMKDDKGNKLPERLRRFIENLGMAMEDFDPWMKSGDVPF